MNLIFTIPSTRSWLHFLPVGEHPAQDVGGQIYKLGLGPGDAAARCDLLVALRAFGRESQLDTLDRVGGGAAHHA